MITPTQQVFLVRHGETEWSLSGQHTGTTDIPLTDHGRQVARLLQPALAKESFVLALTSPLQRAGETCRLAGFGDVANVEPDLMEWNYGRYEGLTAGQIHAMAPGWLLFREGCPGGEMPGEIGVRVDRVIAKARAVEGDVVLFAHGHVLRVFAARFALVGGAGFASAAATAFSLSVLRVTEGGLRSSVYRSIWEQAFIPVTASERSLVKIAVDGVGARIAEGVAAAGLYFWVQRVAPGGNASEALDTRWMAWLTLATVLVWLLITQRLRTQVRQTAPAAPQIETELDCVRFPDQCPCTTELGKGVA